VPDIVATPKLTAAGAARIMAAAIVKAAAMGVPQCIAIVDDGGNLLAFRRMDGAKLLSIRTCQRKAYTAVFNRARSGTVSRELALELALVTQGKFVNLKGAAPIMVDGKVIGAIGVGSGTGEQDLEVALAGIAALPGASSGG